MTAAQRKEMLSAELQRARSQAADVAYRFVRLCEAARPRPKTLGRTAQSMILAAGEVRMLARAVDLSAPRRRRRKS